MSTSPQATPDGERARRARRSRRRRRLKRSAPIAINLAPMIDVTFLLLIFFLVTTTFERAEGILASDLPREAGTPTVALPMSPIVVRLTQTGPRGEDFDIHVDRFGPQPAGFAELTDLLLQIQQQPGFDKETPIIIAAESTVRWDHVVGCWNAALHAGCEHIAFSEP